LPIKLIIAQVVRYSKQKLSLTFATPTVPLHDSWLSLSTMSAPDSDIFEVITTILRKGQIPAMCRKFLLAFLQKNARRTGLSSRRVKKTFLGKSLVGH